MLVVGHIFKEIVFDRNLTRIQFKIELPGSSSREK